MWQCEPAELVVGIHVKLLRLGTGYELFTVMSYSCERLHMRACTYRACIHHDMYVQLVYPQTPLSLLSMPVGRNSVQL